MNKAFLAFVLAFAAVGCEKAVRTEVPNIANAEYVSVPITGDGSLHVEGQLCCQYETKQGKDRARLFIRYWNSSGNQISGKAAGLGYYVDLKAHGTIFHVGKEMSEFRFDFVVPAGTVRADVAFVRPRDQSMWIKRFSCGFKAAQATQFRMGIVSVWFLLFCLGVFAFYFLMPYAARPWVLLVASLSFYALFGIPAFAFVGLSAVSIWLGGLVLGKRPLRSVVSALIVFNVGLLVAAKYLTPFVKGFCLHFDLIEPMFSIVLPLGISFYTLQAVSYCIDVYRGTIPAERNPARLILYLTFFPTVMQGPVSRYGQLGLQLWTPHRFEWERMHSGLLLALWGFFKKMVIADRAALLADGVFSSGSSAAGVTVFLGVLAYSIQIYADFSGCVDICRGISEALGIDLIQNFRHPYFATSVKDFWRRWHISLSSWLKDYVYIPLGGNRHGNFRKYLNVLIVFGVSGIWHGVGINFFIWGLLHGLYQVCDGLTAGLRERILSSCKVDATTFSFRLGQRIMTFFLVAFAWIFFRAPTLADAGSVLRRMCVWNPWTLTDGTYLKFGLDAKDFDVLLVSLVVLLVISTLQERGSVRTMLRRQTLWFRWGVYLIAFFSVLILGIYGPGYAASQFIYMQF